jgi:hypothetical protein
MIALEEMTDEQFERHTLGLLQKELGPYGMARFLPGAPPSRRLCFGARSLTA